MSILSNNDSSCKSLREAYARASHWGPTGTILITTYIGIVGLYATWQLFPPWHSTLAMLHIISIFFEYSYTIYSLVRALWLGPGFVPRHWRPSDAESLEKLSFCEKCNCYKPLRSHHCSKCDRCVLKMDHHCPWINTCCGHLNHGHFIHFLLAAIYSCVHCSSFLFVYLALNTYAKVYQVESMRHFQVYNVIQSLFVLSGAMAAFIVVGAIFFLTFFQIRNISRNMTTLEIPVVEFAKRRCRKVDEKPFVYPYDTGFYSNLRQVISLTARPQYNGTVWPITANGSPFDFLNETKLHKAEREKNVYMVIAVENFNRGKMDVYWRNMKLILTFPYLCCHHPILTTNYGDVYETKNIRGNWLHGKLVKSLDDKETTDKKCGWFPKSTVRLLNKEKAIEMEVPDLIDLLGKFQPGNTKNIKVI